VIVATGLATVTVGALAGLGIDPVSVATEDELRRAFAADDVAEIVVTADITLTCAGGGGLSRDGDADLRLRGGGYVIRQSCENNRVMTVTGDGALEVESVELTGGHCDGDGGAIFAEADVTVTGLVAVENIAGRQGGAIFALGDVVAGDSAFHRNGAGRGGGAIAARGDISLTSSDLAENTADHVEFGTADDGCAPRVTQLPYAADGGAVRGWRDVHVIDSELDGNSASRYGGAIFAQEDVIVTGSMLRDNTADGAGGAIRGFRSVTTTGSDVVDNATGSSGGAVHASAGLVASASRFAGNSAQGSGGAISATGGAELADVTVVDNLAGRSGGGIAMVAPGALAMRDSVVQGNTAPADAEIALRPGVEVEAVDSVIGGQDGVSVAGWGVAVAVLAVLVIGGAIVLVIGMRRFATGESDGPGVTG
jgi:predicted outer membrane repeat protein